MIPEEYYGQKIDDIRNYDVDIFAIGSDWRGHFDYLNEYCDVVYLDRTEGISSTQLREGGHHIALGIVGASRDIAKFIDESKYVSGVDIVGAFPDGDEFDLAGKTTLFPSLEELIEASDALYVANAPERRYATARAGLEAGKNVLSESPVALEAAEAEELFSLAAERKLVFHEAAKTAYALAFSRLTLNVKSGMIGTPVSVRATCTSQAFASPAGSLIGWGPIAVFTKVDFLYPGAVASIEVGSGVKSEGELVIAGTKGYIYVPSPWWKTDYFEIRFEDFSSNKRYFYQLNGEGIRDEISVFAKTIQDGKKPNLDITPAHTIALSRLIESYRNGTMPVYNLGTESEGCGISFFQN